jgi:hypothetical protein
MPFRSFPFYVPVMCNNMLLVYSNCIYILYYDTVIIYIYIFFLVEEHFKGGWLPEIMIGLMPSLFCG